ncbi:hypothetical protein NHQ30_007013 [Ciborinia camelliae]|nr:hypothetical protein NHQ30_007013 [Ciborinia camelliae]
MKSLSISSALHPETSRGTVDSSTETMTPPSPPGAPHPKKFREAIKFSPKAEKAIKRANEQYHHRMAQIMAEKGNNKTADKLDRNPNSEEAVFADGQTSGSVSTNFSVGTATSKKHADLEIDGQQRVIASTGPEVVNDGFVQLSKALKEEESSFWC